MVYVTSKHVQRHSELVATLRKVNAAEIKQKASPDVTEADEL